MQSREVDVRAEHRLLQVVNSEAAGMYLESVFSVPNVQTLSVSALGLQSCMLLVYSHKLVGQTVGDVENIVWRK